MKVCNLDIFYQNARGLRTKPTEFFANVISSSFPVIVITETWLCNEIPSSDYFPSSYNTFRSDRVFSATKQKGGGVLMAVDNSLRSVRRSDIETVPESIWVEINLDRCEKLLIGSFYVPPSITPISFNEIISSIENVIASHRKHRIVVIGDFNTPGIDWSTLKYSHYHQYIENKCSLLLDFLAFNSLEQHNTIANPCGNILDLCISNNQPIEVSLSDVFLVRPDKFHPPIKLTLSLSGEKQSFQNNINNSPRFAFKRGDYVGLHRDLSSIDWSMVTEETNVDDQVDKLTELILSSMRKFIPQYTPKPHKYPPWFSSELISALKHKDRAHRKLKSTPSPERKEDFRCFRTLCKRLYKRDHSSYIAHLEKSASDRPAEFWKYVRKRSNKSGESLILLDSNGTELQAVADCFATQFSSVYKAFDSSTTIHQPLGVSTPNALSLDENLISECIKRLKPSLSCGPDGIPSAILKAYSSILVPVLTSIFNNCLITSTFPSMWKIARVFPVFKSGSKTDVSNYRPISLLCAMSKIFELALHHILSFNVKSSLINNQHGFVPGRSTVTNLASFMTHISTPVFQRGQVDTIYCDLSKAFDVVSHSMLMVKLAHFDVDTAVVNLLHSYLRDRSCYVAVNGQTSSFYKATSGVPQGSVLGPLLFLMYVNDVSSAIRNSSFLLYADDIKIFREINSFNDCRLLQSDLCSFSEWCKNNNLSLNISKTKVMSFTRKSSTLSFLYSVNSVSLSRVCEINDLGVLFDSTLHFSAHTKRVAIRGLRSIGCVCRISREFNSPMPLRKLYTAICLPQLEYASVIWNGISNSLSNVIERVQKKFLSVYNHRFAKNDSGSCSNIIELLSLPSLRCRRNRADLFFLFKLVHGTISCPILLNNINFRIPRKLTRESRPFLVTTRLCQHSTLNRIQSLYNSYFLDLDVFDGSQLSFSSEVCTVVR